MLLRNIGMCLQVLMALQPRQQTSTSLLKCEPQILNGRSPDLRYGVPKEIQKISNIYERTIGFPK